MKEKDIKDILKSKFQLEEDKYFPDQWKTILSLFFKKIDYFSHPENLFTENDKVIDGKQIGTVKLDDGKQLAIFTVEVADSISIVRNRQGLREIAAKHIDQNIIHGALAFFYNKKQADYRFSFIAKEASIDLETGELIKGETKPKRYTYLLGSNEACTTPAKRMLVLADKKEKCEVNINQLKEVFSVEALNKDFFKTYKAHYEKFWKYLADEAYPYKAKLIDAEKDDIVKQEKPIRDFAKKLLGRIVFLHFLQKKGWMGVPSQLRITNERITNDGDWVNGDANFMQNLFANCPDKEHFHSKFLTTLFFKTLNTKRDGDLAPEGLVYNSELAIHPCKIPYLNGGLFEPEKNKATLTIDFPSDYFKELLEFFEQYNFTIDENSPDDHEVGIDPEMLGHIFENLLEDNRDKGAFYTPKEIVQYMCKESLIQYLKNFPPPEGLSDTDKNSPPQDGLSDTDKNSPPQDGLSDTDKNSPPQDGLSDTDKNSPPQEGWSKTGVVRNSQNYFTLPFNPNLKQRAKELRQAGNLSEVLFWNQVKNKQFKGYDFDRQKIVGNYIVDFFCTNCNVVIEIDGSSHDDKQDYDADRDAFLQGLGLTVIHIPVVDVMKNMNGVMEMLFNHPALAGTPPVEGNVEEGNVKEGNVKEGNVEEGKWEKAIEQFIRFHTVAPLLAEKENAVLLNQKLDDIKVCDPAIGSGAFPIGMLQEIFEAKRFIYPYLKTNKPFDPAEVKKNIIQNSIYGVDLEKGAVDIAQLRFWLNLVVDELNPHPLPNLDYKIMQGNSLLEQFQGIDLSQMGKIKSDVAIAEPTRDLFGNLTDAQIKMTYAKSETIDEIQKLINQFFTIEVSEEKQAIRQKINGLVLQHIEYNIELRENQLNRFINEAGKPENLKAPAKKKYDGYVNDLAKIQDTKAQLLKIQDTDERPYFLWHLYFMDVFEKGGFDVMIGNPPYVSVKNILENDKKVFSSIFKTATGQFDLYGLFIEKGIELLNKNSICCFITSNTYLNNKDFYSLRKILINDTEINSIANLDETIFETAQVDVSIIIFKKGMKQYPDIKVYRDKENFLNRKFEKINQAQFDNEILQYEFKLNCSKEDLSILELIFLNKTPLKEILDLPRGIEIGSNSELIKDNDKNSELKLLVGKDIKKYQINYANRFISFNHYDKSNFKDYEIYNQDKLLIQRIRNLSLKTRIVATLDTENYLCTNTLRIGISKSNKISLKYLLIVLNSNIVNYIFLKYFLNKDIYAYQLEQIPIVISIFTKPYEILADYLIYLNDPKQAPVLEKVSNEAISQVFEDLVNMMVYELYFEEEMKAKEINVLQFVTEKAFPDITQAEDKKAIIQKVYYELQQKDNPIRNRILVAGSRSETIARINAATS